MKICPACRYTVSDDAQFCTRCGTPFAVQTEPTSASTDNAAPPSPTQPYAYTPVQNPYDHTADFDAQDITDNKLYASLPYLLGVFGIIISLMIAKSSAFVMFHVRQALKLILAEVLLAAATVLLVWTVIAPMLGGCAALVLLVLQCLGFYQAITGKATDLIFIRNFKI